MSGSVTEERITWNTGEQSTVMYDLGVVPQPVGEAVVLAGGRVVSGKFKGRTVLSPGAQITINPLQCATAKGVELITGPSTLEIL
ncbi:hypothetical protein [Streptomyces sp. CoH27]|uniref:hypothetical protein n=1 Tax=Streptomyces sp. CoH27 TaxID=2875763 RepID=UPI001CD3ED93|nr:hypothetical protein [Streptomyces sp. CoH27]